MAVYKSFPIRDRFNVQFRAEAFNVFNHVNFDGVGLGYGSGTYGQVINTHDPRIMEFAIKLIY